MAPKQAILQVMVDLFTMAKEFVDFGNLLFKDLQVELQFKQAYSHLVILELNLG